MVSNKKRLYIALCPSGVVNNEERRYHWGFLTGPKVENIPQVPGMRYHVKNHPIHGWVYEEVPLMNMHGTNNLLARILIAKIQDEMQLVESFRTTPVVQNDPNWRCRTWVANALSRMAKDGKGVGTAELGWGEIEALARDYVAKKTAAGRYVYKRGRYGVTKGDMGYASRERSCILENGNVAESGGPIMTRITVLDVGKPFTLLPTTSGV